MTECAAILMLSVWCFLDTLKTCRECGKTDDHWTTSIRRIFSMLCIAAAIMKIGNII
jgi:hypothetical protein